jgi:hypothetical protein
MTALAHIQEPIIAVLALTDAQLSERAAAIKVKLETTAKAVIEIGNDLLATRKLIERGRFTHWVEAEIGIPIRQAQRYMAVARLAVRQPEVFKNDKLSPGRSASYVLAARSTPAPVVEAALSRIERGERVKFRDVAERTARMPARHVESPSPEEIERAVEELQRCCCIDTLLRFGPDVIKALCKRVGVKPPSQRREQLRPSPTFVAEFADGERVRMTIACLGGYDWGRGRRLAEAAWRSRLPQIEIEEIEIARTYDVPLRDRGHRTPPKIISCHFEHDGRDVWPD